MSEKTSGPQEAAAMPEDVATEAARDVLAERRRQVEAEGWTPEHDDTHEPCPSQPAHLSARSGDVRVKALEWQDDVGGGLYASFEFGPETVSYTVELADEKLDIWAVQTRVVCSQFGPTEIHKCVGKQNAKSAADAYHEHRILSALSPAGVKEPGEAVAWLKTWGNGCKRVDLHSGADAWMPDDFSEIPLGPLAAPVTPASLSASRERDEP